MADLHCQLIHTPKEENRKKLAEYHYQTISFSPANQCQGGVKLRWQQNRPTATVKNYPIICENYPLFYRMSRALFPTLYFYHLPSPQP